jgi:octaprenyl-diphosphate synthase
MNPNPIQTPAEPDVVKRITDYLAADLNEVGAILRQSLDTESEIIREVGEYLAITPGKKLRPMLTLLTAKALAPEKAAPIEVAAALEFVHVATLLHDDVIDKAETRRGRPSVNARWGDDVAILMADFLYAGAFDLALRSLKPEVLRLICQVSQRMCEGEMLQIKLRNRTYTTQEYIEVVGRKTGSLFSACTSLGALFADRSTESVAAASTFGYDFGIAFQITDDVLDFTADPAQLGKEIGMDVLGGKQTLPVLLALERASETDRDRLETWLRNGRDLLPILETVDRYRGIDLALDRARQYADRAIDALDRMDCFDAEARDCLSALPSYVLSRSS